MMRLADELRNISEQVKQQRHLMKTEEATKQVSIRPFIEALGYNTLNLSEVEPEYFADAKTSGAERVDYAIKREGEPIFLIEAKSANKPLSDNHWKQLREYYGALEVRFGILTNGIEFHFYTDLKKLNIMDKEPFLTVDMLELDERLVNELEGFTKTSFDPERILSSARKLTVYRLLQKEFDQPSDEFVRHFAKSVTSEKLSIKEMQEIAANVKEALHEHINKENTVRRPTTIELEPSRPESEAAETLKEMPSLRKRQIIEIPVIGVFEGVMFDATLLFDTSSKLGDHSMSRTKIRFRNRIVSVNKAELMARQSVNPDAKELWKGWDRWQLHDPTTGKLREIRQLLKDDTLLELFLRDA